MTDDCWFVLYKGQGKREVWPVSAKGWAALAGFIVLTLLPLPLLILHVERAPWVLVPHLLWIAAVTFGFVRFVRAHSEVIDLRQESADWREFQAWKEERRRRGGR